MRHFKIKLLVALELEAATDKFGNLEEATESLKVIALNRRAMGDLLAQIPCECPEHWQVKEFAVEDCGELVDTGQPELAYDEASTPPAPKTSLH